MARWEKYHIAHPSSLLSNNPLPDTSTMPHVVQPSGGGGRILVRYTPRRKHGLIAASKWLVAEGMTLQKATAELRVSHSNLAKRTAKGIGNINSPDKILKSKKKSTGNGPLGQLKSLEDALLRYIFKLCKQRVIVNTFIVVLRASFHFPEFHTKTYTAHCSVVKCFFTALLFAYQMGTHTLQRLLAEVECEALDFMVFMCRIIFGANRDRRFVINMDQTPVYFSMNAKRTLELIKKTIHIRTSMDNTKRVTVAVMICADGTLLLLVLVFKRQPNGRIVKKEFPSGDYPPNHFYHCQPAAWMDKTVMIAWVKTVLNSYVVTAPDHIVLIVILDMYRCHMMASVVQMIKELGIKVKHIPGGCTPSASPSMSALTA